MLQVTNDIKIKDISNIINEKTPSFSGIVSQECKGNLWVDTIESPRIAIAESFAVGSHAFIGTYKNKEDFVNLKTFLEDELFHDLKESEQTCFEFSVESENLRTPLLELFQDKLIQSEKEFSFRTNKIPNHTLPLSSIYQISKVESDFWARLSAGGFENEDFLKNRLLESWHSFEEFDKHSISYCIIYENRIVAVMIGTASFYNIIAIDIETEEAHQRKGLAYAMATEFISDCLKHGYTPQWDCVESNPASYQLAEKLGFEQIGENTVYWFDI